MRTLLTTITTAAVLLLGGHAQADVVETDELRLLRMHTRHCGGGWGGFEAGTYVEVATSSESELPSDGTAHTLPQVTRTRIAKVAGGRILLETAERQADGETWTAWRATQPRGYDPARCAKASWREAATAEGDPAGRKVVLGIGKNVDVTAWLDEAGRLLRWQPSSNDGWETAYVVEDRAAVRRVGERDLTCLKVRKTATSRRVAAEFRATVWFHLDVPGYEVASDTTSIMRNQTTQQTREVLAFGKL